jgi:hypothetical protein
MIDEEALDIFEKAKDKLEKLKERFKVPNRQEVLPQKDQQPNRWVN